jgi:uncharacterized protein (DUF2235 family)
MVATMQGLRAMSKNIVICCDGTSNEIKENLSNVLKLFRTLRKSEEQVVFYDPGIGTISSSDAWSRLKNRALQVFGLATGFGLDDNILDSYRFLIENYEDGDRIYLFGFSRGAYTVRALAGFLRLIGLLQKPQKNLCEYALIAYKLAAEKGDFEIAYRFERITQTRHIPIKFIGVWDTVSSVIAPRLSRLYFPRQLTLPYTRNNSHVEVFRQARAIDERRRMFRLNRWDEPQIFKPNPFDPSEPISQNVKQVWFAGDHSDVGGGYPEMESGLAKFPLAWMITEAKAHGLIVNTAMFNHLVLGREHSGSRRIYVRQDALAKLHVSLTFAWKFLECLPKSAEWKEWQSRKTLFGYYIPRGEPRLMNVNDLVHYSVFDRAEAIASYRPPNLLPKDQVIVEGESGNSDH